MDIAHAHTTIARSLSYFALHNFSRLYLHLRRRPHMHTRHTAHTHTPAHPCLHCTHLRAVCISMPAHTPHTDRAYWLAPEPALAAAGCGVPRGSSPSGSGNMNGGVQAACEQLQPERRRPERRRPKRLSKRHLLVAMPNLRAQWESESSGKMEISGWALSARGCAKKLTDYERQTRAAS